MVATCLMTAVVIQWECLQYRHPHIHYDLLETSLTPANLTRVMPDQNSMHNHNKQQCLATYDLLNGKIHTHHFHVNLGHPEKGENVIATQDGQTRDMAKYYVPAQSHLCILYTQTGIRNLCTMAVKTCTQLDG